jgi:hypothetical protein
LAIKKPLKTLLVAGICVGVAATLVILLSPTLFPPKYRVDIDVVQSGLTIKFIKIKVTNSGVQALTDVKVSFDNEIQNVGTLNSGQSVWLTPATKTPPLVTVTSAEGIKAMKNIEPKFLGLT